MKMLGCPADEKREIREFYNSLFPLFFPRVEGREQQLVQLHVGLVVTSVPKVPIWKAFDFNLLCRDASYNQLI